MTDKAISPLRQRMIEDMTARHFAEKVQKQTRGPPFSLEKGIGLAQGDGWTQNRPQIDAHPGNVGLGNYSHPPFPG